MFVEVPGAAVAAVMAMSLYCAVADDLMGTATLASPHALHLHALAQDLHVAYTLAADRCGMLCLCQVYTHVMHFHAKE